MPRTGLILARYTIMRDGVGLSLREQATLINNLNDARPISYRVADPRPSDFNTYIIQPRTGTRKAQAYLTWRVCKDLNFRQVRKVDRKRQSVSFKFEDTDDCAIARIVALPRLGVIAAEDTSGEGHLGGWSAIKRFQAIIETYDEDLEFAATIAGTPQDLERAVSTWAIERFTFQARPFNPHPKNPGLILSALMAKDGVGELRGVALPKQGGHIQPRDEGIVKETMGLANDGYAVYGADGITPSGAEARIKRQSFSFDRQTNLERMRGPQQLRVYIEADEEDDQVKKMADVLIDFFDLG